MTSASSLVCESVLRSSAAAIAMAVTCIGAAAALPPFTLNPTAAGLNGVSFTADNLLISDFSTVTFTSPTTFTDTGYLAVSAVQFGATTFTPGGLNNTYGLYFAFTGTGTTTAGDPTLTSTLGSFTSLTYALYGYNGAASFGFSGNSPTETASGEVLLATGSLVPGSSFVSTNPGVGGFFANAGAGLSFDAAPSAFFASPSAFYDLAVTSFSNTPSEVEPFDGGFRIRQGGGSINFASAVPEPETYAMLLAGLGVVGFVARRRRETGAR